jgi:HlyD family secretion protein
MITGNQQCTGGITVSENRFSPNPDSSDSSRPGITPSSDPMIPDTANIIPSSTTAADKKPVVESSIGNANKSEAVGDKSGKRGNARKRKAGKKRKRAFVVIPIIILVLAVAGWQVKTRFFSTQAVAVQTQRLSQVTRGNLVVAVTGSGPLQPVNKRTVSAEVNSTILEILHKDGDSVKTGDILITLDSSDAESALENAESSLQEVMVTAESTSSDLASLNVRAPFDGMVSEISVKPDDSVSKNGPLLTLTDTKHMILTVPFGISDKTALKAGQTATLTIPSLSGTVSGTVALVGHNGYTSSDGGVAVDVEISVRNPGALAAGMSAEASIQTASGSLTALSEGLLEYENVKVIRSDAGGDVISVSVHKNQAVAGNALLVVMENTALDTTAQSEKTKIDNLTTAVEDAQANLDSCTVRAPMDGIVTGLDGTVGDSVKAGAALCSILDTTAMTMKVSIDELDIGTIIPGQSVTSTVDAVPATAAKALTGTVTSIAVEGSSSNGVTTYPVTLTLDPDARLKSGMNADASILVTNKENVLLVPIEAVTTINDRTFVYVSGTPSISPSATGGAFGFPGGGGPGGADPTGGADRTAGISDASGTAALPAASPGTGGTAASGTARQRNRTGTTGTTGTAGSAGSTTGRTAGSSGINGAADAMPGSSQGGFTRPGAAADTGYYAGATLVMVEVGEHNETYMEIVSGLSENDQVVLPALTTTTGTTGTTTTQSSGFAIPGMGGGMGGAAPAGSDRFPRD